MNIVEKNIDKIKALCHKHNVAKLFVFGSVVNNRLKKNSDIDFVVDFDRIDLYDYADNYFDFKFSLEDLFNREVDLLEEKAIKNPYLLESINATKRLVYG